MAIDIQTLKQTEPYIPGPAHELQTLDVYQVTKSPSARWLM